MLNFYLKPPEFILKLNEIEEIINERLKIYRVFKKNRVDDYFMLHGTKWKETNIEILNKLNLLDNIILSSTNQNYDLLKQKDETSNWLLQLAFSQKPELHKIFIDIESQIFILRMRTHPHRQLVEYLQNHALLPPLQPNQSDMYTIHFSHAPEFLNMSQLPFHLTKGRIIFPDSCLPIYAFSQFRERMEKRLIYLSKCTNRIDERLIEIFKCIRSLADPIQTNCQLLQLDDVDSACETDYPLCMWRLHRHLRQTHHLKYFGRMQYGLFLKSAGLTLNENLELFREEFKNDMNDEQFSKRYSYLFHHNYGLVGRKRAQFPYNCRKIQEMAPKSDQPWGCPFKHLSINQLDDELIKFGINDVASVLQLVDDGLYGRACGLCLEKRTNNQFNGKIVTHPNDYFVCSFKCHNDMEDFYLDG